MFQRRLACVLAIVFLASCVSVAAADPRPHGFAGSCSVPCQTVGGSPSFCVLQCPILAPRFCPPVGRGGFYCPPCGIGYVPNYYRAYYAVPLPYYDVGVNFSPYNRSAPPAAPENGPGDGTVIAPPATPSTPTPPAPAPGEVAEIDLTVPAGAVVWFQGIKVKQTGAVRFLVTPPLRPGQSYAYEVRATYAENGREVTSMRQLSVRAGDRLEALFLALPAAPTTTTARADR